MTAESVQRVPLLDIRRTEAPILEEMKAALAGVMDSGMFVLGGEVKKLEETLAAYSQAAQGVACASGSEALLMALMACDIRPGDEVIVPSFTFFATASAVARLGAVPVFADIREDTWNINPEDVRRKVTPRTKAVIPVHLFGLAAEMDALNEIAAEHGLMMVEDAAQSIGAEYTSEKTGKSSRVGGLGDVCCFSFYPTKNLGACGDGGALTTDNDEMAEKLRLIRNHGMAPRYYHQVIGINGRLDAFQGAILNVKFPHLDTWTGLRQENARRYRELFLAAGLEKFIQLPVFPETGRHVWNQFSVLVKDGKRDAMREFLAGKNVGTEIYYPMGLHEQACFAYLGAKPGDLPVTDMVTRSVTALPIFPGMTPEEQAYVVDSMAEFFAA